MNETELVKTTLKKAEPAIKNLPDCKWTREIMIRLCEAGKNSYRVRASEAPKADPGWLYDMTWLQYNEMNNEMTYLADVSLVLECEWGGFPEILFDFEKLLLAKAYLRCMIFWAADRKGAIKNLQKLVIAIDRFHGTKSKDSYFFCVWLGDEARFHFYSYTPENGTDIV